MSRYSFRSLKLESLESTSGFISQTHWDNMTHGIGMASGMVYGMLLLGVRAPCPSLALALAWPMALPCAWSRIVEYSTLRVRNHYPYHCTGYSSTVALLPPALCSVFAGHPCILYSPYWRGLSETRLLSGV